jgi:hypothetical protein
MQGIAFVQRQVERGAEQLHHLAARLRASGFQKAYVSGRDICISSQFDLGEAANVAPMF